MLEMYQISLRLTDEWLNFVKLKERKILKAQGCNWKKKIERRVTYIHLVYII